MGDLVALCCKWWGKIKKKLDVPATPASSCQHFVGRKAGQMGGVNVGERHHPTPPTLTNIIRGRHKVRFEK